MIKFFILGLIPCLFATKGEEIRVGEGLGRLHVFGVVALQEAPMTKDAAMPLILSNKRSAEAVAQEMKALKDRANIVYVGEFAKDAKELMTTDGNAAAGS